MNKIVNAATQAKVSELALKKALNFAKELESDAV